MGRHRPGYGETETKRKLKMMREFPLTPTDMVLKVPYVIIEVKISKKLATRIKRMRRNKCNDVIKKLTSYIAAEI